MWQVIFAIPVRNIASSTPLRAQVARLEEPNEQASKSLTQWTSHPKYRILTGPIFRIPNYTKVPSTSSLQRLRTLPFELMSCTYHHLASISLRRIRKQALTTMKTSLLYWAAGSLLTNCAPGWSLWSKHLASHMIAMLSTSGPLSVTWPVKDTLFDGRWFGCVLGVWRKIAKGLFSLLLLPERVYQPSQMQPTANPQTAVRA